jgi:anti-sigma factor RsiW
MTCQEVWRAIDPYLDDELTVLEVLRVQGHLLGCRACRRVLNSESHLHALLAADALQDEPPAALRERIRQQVLTASPGPRESRVTRRWSLVRRTSLVAAIALAFLLGVVQMPSVRPRTDVPPLAVEVVAKHRLYNPEDGPRLEQRSSDAPHLERWLERRLAFPVKVPALVAGGEHLVGGRVSSLADAPAAYLLYEQDGRRISLFITPLPTPGASEGAKEGTERPPQLIEGVEVYTASLSSTTVMWWDAAEQRYVAASTSGTRDLEAFARLCIRSGRRAGTGDPASPRDHSALSRGSGAPFGVPSPLPQAS